MSLDANEFLRAVKRAAIDAVRSLDLTDIREGEVVTDSPLSIRINQKLTLSSKYLILTDAVRDITVDISVDHTTENTSGGSGDSSFASHNHAYKGKKQITIHRALRTGEKVILIKASGGQKYVVLNRVEGWI